MTPEAFLKEFNIFINAPNGINELRRFVIDLAVKGKLIDQATMDSTDNSTFEWELESLRLKESEIWEPEFWITDPPTNWLKCPLAHIGNWGSGGTPKRSNSDYFGGSIPWVVIGDLTNGYVSQSAEQITKLGLEMSSAKMIPTGSVLFAMYGASIGKLGITEFECCTNQAIAHCIPDERFINAEYLLLLLSSLKQEFINKGKGGAQPNINQIILKHCLVYVPPLEEQERIVARVNELMELCDRLEEEQQATKAFSDELRVSTFHHMVQSEKPEDAHDALQILIEESGLLLKKPEDVGIIRNSIRALAVSGRLRTSSESDEPAALILDECIQLRKRHLENGELFQKEIFNPVDKVDEIIDLPKKWVWSRLGNILSKMGAGSTPKGGRKVYVEEGIIFLRSQNIYNDGLKLDDVAKIPIEIHQKMKGTHVRPGDVVLNITGASIARCALVPENFDTANVNQHVAICRPLKPDLNNWIHLFLTSPIGYNLIMERQVGMSREGLSMGRLGIFPIPLPPLEEQKRIVARVDELMELCDQLETKLFSQMELADEYVTASTHALVS